MNKINGLKLVKRCFHTLTEDGKLDRQGRVLAMPGQGVYFVEWLSWVDGCPTHETMVKLEDMLNWIFYADAEHMKFSAEHGHMAGQLTRK